MFTLICFTVLSLFSAIACILVSGTHKKRKIEFRKAERELVIDDFYILVRFRDGTLNHTLFEYLHENPNRVIEYSELDENIFKSREIDLNKVVDAMGFKGDFKKLLFSFDNKSIIYHPDKINSVETIKIA